MNMKTKTIITALMLFIAAYAFAQFTPEPVQYRLWKSILKDSGMHSMFYNRGISDLRGIYYQNEKIQAASRRSGGNIKKQRLDSATIFTDSSSTWVPSVRVLFTYEADGMLLSLLYRTWYDADSRWGNALKFEYTYDSNGRLVAWTGYEWDTTAVSWVNVMKFEFVFDSNNNVVTETLYSWDITSNGWANLLKSEYGYDGSGKLMTETDYTWDDSLKQWVNSKKFEYTYDGNGNTTKETGYLWGSANKWELYWKEEYTYDASGNLLSEAGYNWFDPEWIGFMKYVYTYDGNGNLLTETEYTWDMLTKTWVNSQKFEYTYDGNGNPVMEINYKWDSVSGQWINFSKEEYTFDLTVLSSELIGPDYNIAFPSELIAPDYVSVSEFSNKLIETIEYDWDQGTGKWMETAKTVLHYSTLSTPANVTLSADPVEGGSVKGPDQYFIGDTVTVTATAADGYKFVNWTENGTEVSTDTAYTFEVKGDRALVANFAQGFTIYVTINPAGGGSVTGAGVYLDGESVSLAATPSDGYKFVNWTENGNEVSADATYTFVAKNDRSLVANFVKEHTISVSVDPAGGGTATGAGVYLDGDSVSVTATAAAEYKFINWTENGNEVSKDAIYTFTAKADRTLVANFAKGYTISASVNPADGGSVTGTGVYLDGESVSVTATAADGYKFLNWTENRSEVSKDATYTFTAKADRALVANFAKGYNISVSVEPAEGGSVTGAGVYFDGESVTLTATAATGYKFVNWTENGSEVSSDATLTFTASADRSLIANFLKEHTISVSVDPADGGSATGAGVYLDGEPVTLTATATAGYMFVNWTENGNVVSTDATYTFTANANRTLVANFAKEYIISASVDPADGGSVTGGGSYPEGQSASLKATPAKGYKFVNWTENGNEVSTDATYTFVVNGDRDLVAHFAIITALTDDLGSNEIILYPNPTSDILTIDLKDAVISDPAPEMTIYDRAGKQWSLKVRRLSDSMLEAPVKDIPAGLYMLKINTDNTSRTFKLMINK